MSGDDDGFDLDDLNLDDWVEDLDAHAEAESAPMPQRTAPQAPARPLYEPPRPDAPIQRPPPRPAPIQALDDDDDDDDDDIESTRIAAIPQELINSLVSPERQRETARPPAGVAAPAARAPAAPAAIDMDLDGLLDSLGSSSSSTVIIDSSDELDPFAEDDEDAREDDDLVSSFAPPRRANLSSDAGVLGLDESELRALGSPKGDDVLGLDAPDRPDAASAAPAAPAEPAPPSGEGPLPRPGEEVTRPRLPGKLGALSQRLKPRTSGVPAVPGPPKPVPKPGAKLPPLPRPGALPPRRPGALPALPRPGDLAVAKGAQPEAPETADAHDRPTPVPSAEPPTGARAPGGDLDADLDQLLDSSPPSGAAPDSDERESRELIVDGSPGAAPAADEGESGVMRVPEAEADDSGVMLVAGPSAPESDEMTLVAADEGESGEMVVAAAGDDGDWDEDELAAIEAAEREAEAQAREARDRGAEAARRSVRSRKPRDEHFPMVGDGGEALRLRRRLLEKMAEARDGELAARLHVAAAEIAEQLGEADDARALYEEALEEAPDDVVALRALRRDAARRGAWDRLAELFEAEAELELSAWERATALTGLAELHLSRRDDAAAAEKAALAALEIQPSSIVAALLVAEARWRQDKAAEALAPLAALRSVWDDPDARAALAIEEARTKESAGDREGARELFTWANEVDPEALDGWFGRARTSSRKDADPKGAAEALETIAAYCVGTPLAEAVATRASRVATSLVGDPALGVRLLEGAIGVAGLQARAEAALQTDDRALWIQTVEAWASAAGGTDRALALVRLAEIRAGQGDLDGAEAALRDAALADGSLGTIRVVREVIARRSGDVERLVDAAEGGGALARAARLARDPDALTLERELLDQAVAEGQALVAADVLELDVAAAQGDETGVDVALRRQADRVPPEQRIGSLLVMAERAIERDQLDAAETLLSEARQILPGDPLVLRPLGRLATRRDARDAAAFWLEEASVAAGPRAAHAATQAGRILAAAGHDAIGAHRRALEAVTGYRPAAWALRPLAMEAGDALTLGELYEQLADTAASPAEEAAHLVRGALLRADADPASAGALLERARAKAPEDAVLSSLILRLAGTTSPSERAKMLVRAGEHAPADLARVFRLQASAAFEEAGEAATAAAELRRVAEAHPDDPYVRAALDRVEIAAGEVARVASRRFDELKAATTDEAKTAALEALARLDLDHRNDPASAALSLQALLEISPGHLPSLRTLQRYFAGQRRTEDAAQVVGGLARHLDEGPDVTSHLRLAHRLLLADPEAPGEAPDELVFEVSERAELDLWLAPRLLEVARVKGDVERQRRALSALSTLLGAADERAAARLRAAELEEGDAKLALLRDAAHSSPTHPLTGELLALACEEAGDRAGAAAAWELAGDAAAVARHAARAFYAAGVHWQEIGELEKARAALARASERDVTYEDVFDRLHGLLTDADDKAGLADLYAARLAVGGPDDELYALYMKQADLRVQIQDLAGAKAALRAAIALRAEDVDALRKLADVSLEDEDWRGAAEVLIRIARVRKEREELRWVFFTLGDIYDRHMPDPSRAEAAYKRVLKLFPRDLPAMERLAALYVGQRAIAQAAEVLEELAKVEIDSERNLAHRLQLAGLYEEAGDARKTEATLEEARRHAATDLVVVRALADFYHRQKADAALAMHLRRAVNDFRHAIESDLGDAAAWPGLVEVLRWGNHLDAASCAASAASAAGTSLDPEAAKLVDARGSAAGAGARAAAGALDELLAPPALSPATRAVFRLAGEALEKSLPLDLNAYRAEKIDRRDTTIRPLAAEVARWFGIGDVELYVTAAAPRVCVPVFSNPCTILLGAELLAITDEREKLFVLARALKIAKSQLSIAVRAQPLEVVTLVGGLVHSFDQHHMPAGVDPAHVAEAARRVVRNLVRRGPDELGPLVFEMAGRPGYDPAQLAMAASQWGNRVALLAVGSVPSAVSALAKLSGERELPADPTARVAMLQRFTEAADLLRFAISDVYFDARQHVRGGAGG
ncbi:MAG: hypothetical protein KF729_23815 [Sandaracinaceae bacterium]|nr:hypothetical protein [Sandaracinaceae bacterium]